MTRSPRAAALMPSTICVAGVAFEMNPHAPAAIAAFAIARSSAKLNTTIAPFEGSEAIACTCSRIPVASPYVSNSVTSTARAGVALTSSSTTAIPGA